jgi:hypothetical protein
MINVNERSEMAHNVFLNQDTIKGFNGFVGFGIRELTSTEFRDYCITGNVLRRVRPFIQIALNFSSDFKIRSFSSACYYIDESSDSWSSFGLTVLSDSNHKYTHCLTNHLTKFASGNNTGLSWI